MRPVRRRRGRRIGNGGTRVLLRKVLGCTLRVTSAMVAKMNDRFEKDARLAEDIRHLGRILGDTIRAYEGEAAFALVEDIRQLAVASRRLEDTDSATRLSRVLDG